MSKQRGEAKETKEKCAECGKISGCDSWLSCEVCDGWYHAKCVGIKEEAYKMLQELETCHWFCSGCNKKVGKIIPNLVRLNDRVTEVDKKVSKLEVELTACSENVGKMKDEMCGRVAKLETEMASKHLEFKNLNQVVEQIDDAFQKLVNERLENVVEKHTISFTDIVKQQLEEEMVKNVGETVRKEVHESLGKVSENIHEVQSSIQETKIQAAEQRDHESRRNNIILYRVPEGDAPSNEERNKQDLAFCLQLFNTGMQVGIGEEDLVHVFRLGKRPESGAPRPLMVQLTRYNLKNLIMESLFKLKQSEQKFRQIVIAHDMTKAEREHCRNLVADARDMATDDTSGEFIYRVRGPPGDMKILKLRKRN